MADLKCFVDRSKGSSRVKDVPIYFNTDLNPETKAVMIVSTTYEFESIRERIHKRCKDIQVIPLD